MSAAAGLLALAASCAAAWLTGAVSRHRDKALPLPGRRAPRHPDWDDPPGPTKGEHLDAVQALCADSEPYVASRLAGHEPELSYLAELLLELDDQAPRPSGLEDA